MFAQEKCLILDMILKELYFKLTFLLSLLETDYILHKLIKSKGKLISVFTHSISSVFLSVTAPNLHVN